MNLPKLWPNVGGTNTLLVPPTKKIGGPVPPVPMVVAPMVWSDELLVIDLADE